MQFLKKTVILLIIISGFYCNLYSQIKSTQIDNFYTELRKTLSVKKNFKDSLAFYTCNIQIELRKANNFKPYVVSSDTTISNKIENIGILKSYDYRKMMGNSDDIKLILPIAIIIMNSKHGQKFFDVNEFEKIMKMFYHAKAYDDKKNIFYLSPYIVFDDRIEYN